MATYEGNGGATNAEDMESSKMNLLTFDGGGIRGYSSLLVLRQLMDRIAKLETSPWVGETDFDETANNSHGENARGSNLHGTKRILPCDYFDYIGGTSTGGLIAIMLGRLRMTADECLQEYKRIGNEVFGKPRLLHRLTFGLAKRSKYDHTALERVFKSVLEKRTSDGPDAPFESSVSGARTFVFASQLQGDNYQLATFRTYEKGAIEENQESVSQQTVESQSPAKSSLGALSTSSLGGRSTDPSPHHAVRIWEVARASTAAPFFFSPLRLAGPSGQQTTYVDGGISVRNPTIEAIREVENGVGSQRVGTVVSLGNGRPALSSRGSTDIIASRLIKHSLISDIDDVHRRVSRIAERDGFSYFRFEGSMGAEDISLDKYLPSKSNSGRSDFDGGLAALGDEILRDCAAQLVAGRRKRQGIRNRSRYAAQPAQDKGLDGRAVSEPEPTIVAAPPEPSSGASSLASTPVSLLHDGPGADALRALFDPKAYFTEMDTLESQVLSMCDLRGLVDLDSSTDVLSISRIHETPTVTGDAEASAIPHTMQQLCITAVTGVLNALKLMQQQSFCGPAIVVLAMDYTRRDVVRATTLAISDVARFGEALEQRAIDQPLCVRYATELLRCFGARFGHVIATSHDRDTDTFWIRMHCTCALLALAVRSYAGSHRSSVTTVIGSHGKESIKLDMQTNPESQQQLYFRRQPLACLHEYLGGPVWVFGQAAQSAPSYLAITLDQFSSLWGPLLAIPAPTDPHRLLGIRTERGLLLHSGSPKSSGDDAEYPLRWQHMDYHEIEDILTLVSDTSKDMLWFPVDGVYLIGHPQDRGLLPESADQRSTGTGLVLEAEPPFVRHGLRCNAKCSFTFADFKHRHYAQIRLARTERDRMKLDAIQATLTVPAAKFVVPGFGATFKSVPGRKLKDSVLLFCSIASEDPEWLDGILNYRVGLEYSACSRNAQRITLLEALKLAFPQATQRLQEAYDGRKGEVIMPYLEFLKDTGIDDRGRLQVLFSDASGVPHIYEEGSGLPNWMAMLQDDLKNACFAVLSPRCLEFTERDKARIVRSICSRKPKIISTLAVPVFSTKINIRTFVPEPHKYDVASGSYSLRPGTRMSLGSGESDVGSMEIRSNPHKHRAGQMAYFSPYSFADRAVYLVSRALTDKAHGPNDEVVNMDLVSKYTVSVFITDQLPHAFHFGFRRGQEDF
ncbi:hypothetical protein LTR17_013173 [Elasticomyces elasticus]|nr:hypothetical protein LTR17_013173 [Elasticomyces elasticus]